MLRMLRDQATDYPLEEVRDAFEKSNRGGRKSRRRNRKGNRSGGKRRYNDENMVRVVINHGYKSGVKPGDVIHSVASSSNIPGKVIGAINIENDQTWVDIPQEYVGAVLKKGGNGKIRGKSMTLQKA